jgi:TonB family protein
LTRFSCRETEVRAGAIALGEATDAEREAYRRHLATCASCLHANGGEREIERTMARVAQARDAETWEPDLSRAVRDRINAPSHWVKVGFAVVGACAAIALSLHLFAGTGMASLARNPLVVHYDGSSLVLERRSTEQQARVARVPAPKMVVTHNVVILSRAPQPAEKRVASAAVRTPNARRAFVVPTPSYGDGVPVWRQGGGASTTVTHVTRTVTQSSAPVTGPQMTAVAIAPSYSTREASPVGGETAINPQPSEIAYAQGANGTTVFEVLIDDRGNATKCSITKSSGYLALDDAVCKAAMSVHYTPQIVNGRPQSGVYRDAFTFRDNGGGGGD